MFTLASVAAGTVSTFLKTIRCDDRHLHELLASLDEQLLHLSKTLGNVDANLSPIHSSIPFDWWNELEQGRYEMEDIQHTMNLANKKAIITKFLQTNINYVAMMQSKLLNTEHETEAGDRVFLGNEPLIGRGDDKLEIIQRLKTTDSMGVSITGIGGIGKTVLARAIGADPSIKSYFDCVLFPPQSSNFSSKYVLDYIKGVGVASTSQRVLIILDGIQSVTLDVWYHFLSQFHKLFNPEGKVLVTTQNPRVAYVTGTSKYCLHPLLKKDCFSLICDLANTNENLRVADDHAIRHNEKELVDTCRGLPLLATKIGLLLAASEPGNRLDKIKDITTSTLWKVSGLERVLSNLNPVSMIVQDPNLRRCLAYCSLFPQDYEFKKENLVQLWMAEGFAPPSTDTSYLEKITNGYFDKLLSYSLFQTSASPPGKKPNYKLHGLFYDMALTIASSTVSRKIIGNSISNLEISSSTRHFSLSCKVYEHGDGKKFNVDHLLRDIERLRGLRTFLLLGRSGKNISKNPTFFRKLVHLRLLDLSHTNLTKLDPKNISKLKYLRYLNLSYTPLKTMPKLSNNPELQVLKLYHCDNLLILPKELTKLTNLISLKVFSRGLRNMPSGIGNLTNLKRLDVFIVGKEKGLKITELGNLKDLRNLLRITNLENVETKQEAQEAMMHNKGKLERLKLEWSAPNDDAKQVLEGLEPPKNLKELMIKNYSSDEFPDWLSRTEVCGLLKFIHLDRCKALPSVNQLPLLKTLCVEAMHDITSKKGAVGVLPFIETLVLCDMHQLNGWIQLASSYMPRLCNVRVEKCRSLLTLPQLDCLESLEKLEISWCTKLEELPILPQSLKSLIINGCYILKQRCQVGQADWSKIRGIKVEIDLEPVDTSVYFGNGSSK